MNSWQILYIATCKFSSCPRTILLRDLKMDFRDSSLCNDLIGIDSLRIYMICWDEILICEPLASLITFFRTSLIKFYRHSQRMSDSFYHITESRELKKEKKKKKTEHTHSAMFWIFLRRMASWCKRTYSVTYDVKKSYRTRVWDKKFRNGYITLEIRVVMW